MYLLLSGQKKVSDLLKMELPRVVSLCVGAGNQKVLCSNSTCPHPVPTLQPPVLESRPLAFCRTHACLPSWHP